MTLRSSTSRALIDTWLALVALAVLTPACARTREQPQQGSTPEQPFRDPSVPALPPGTEGGAGESSPSAPTEPADPGGTWIDRYALADGTIVRRARDLSSDKVSIVAITSNAEVKATTSSDGGFTFPGLSVGQYWIRVDEDTSDGTPPYFLLPTAQRVELGSDRVGRPDVHRPIEPTYVEFSPAAPGLSPWAWDHQLQYAVAGAGAFGDLTWAESTQAPNEGDSSLGMSVGWHSLFNNPLIDATQGDQMIVTQLEAVDHGGAIPHYAIARSMTAAPFSMADGQTSTTTGVFAPVANRPRGTLVWARSDFHLLSSMNHKAATPIADVLMIKVQPSTSEFGFVTYDGPDLLQYWAEPDSADLVMADVEYPNPFPESWPMVGLAYSYFAVPILAPGAAVAREVWLSMGHSDRVEAFVHGVITPRLSPVQDLEVDAVDAAVGHGVAPRARISWRAPAIGAPSGYSVYVYVAKAVDGRTVLESRGQVYVRGTRLQLPPGMLSVGDAAFMMVRATAAPGVDLPNHPFASGLSYAVADAATAVMTVE